MPSRRELAKNNARNQNIIMLIVGVGLILVAIAVFLALPKPGQEALQTSSIQTVPVEVNYEAPDIKLTDLQGNAVAFSDYRGKVILYNAWATWCPPCKAEMPTLQAYYEKYKDQGLVIIAIEDGQPVEEVAKFVQDYGLTFPVWPDLKWVASETYNFEALPASVVIDRNGTARLTWRGAISSEMLEKYVTPLLEEN